MEQKPEVSSQCADDEKIKEIAKRYHQMVARRREEIDQGLEKLLQADDNPNASAPAPELSE